jgi:hypothetical protein
MNTWTDGKQGGMWKMVHGGQMSQNDEEYLLDLITSTLHGMKLNIKVMTSIPDPTECPAGFTDGKIVGYSHAVNSLEAALRIYKRKKDGTLPIDDGKYHVPE